VYKRDQWDEFFCFVGHNAPVVAVRPNPRLFYTPVAPSAGATGDGGGPETIVARGVGQKGGGGPGGSGAGGVEVSEEPSTVFALASMDKQFSVWSSGRPRAVVLGSRVSKLGILDAAWTPDGYNLVVLSLDGAVVTCRCV
jgi:protein HIRA/HIR1